MRYRSAWMLLLSTAAACGDSAPRAVAPTADKASAPATGKASCPKDIDVAELLARHGSAFGTAAAVDASLPRTFRFDEELAGKRGQAELVLDRSSHRFEELVGGVHQVTGIDHQGAWHIGIPGVPFRLRPDEAAPIALDAWIARRSYLTAFDPKRDNATCFADATGSPRVRLKYALVEVGSPALDFELASAAMLSSSASAADGRPTHIAFESWSAAEGGVRWPLVWRTGDSAGNRTTYRAVENAAGLRCKGVNAGAAATGECLGIPAPNLAFDWPASGVVTVPMKHYLGEISLRVRADDKEVWALLDSGAGITVVEASSPASAAFVSGLELMGSGSSQKVSAGLGELKSLSIGGLGLRHLPSARIPIPALDGFGNRRPEIILGVSFFLGAAVRVDWAKSEVVFAKSAGALHKPNAERIPLRVLEDKPVADLTVGGTVGAFLVDTGNSGGVDMIKTWADAHGFPGKRPTVDLVAKTGAGNDETRGTLFRLETAALGSVKHDDSVVQIDDPPSQGVIAGLVGNQVFSHCAATVFDLAERTLWLEGPCDRAVPESKSGWRLGKHEDTKFKDQPWVVEKLVPSGSAERAGIQIGDRILSVGGVAAQPDLSKLEPVLEASAGTKVKVILDRKGERKVIEVVLRKLLAP
jgi:hypothetical protein